jgi:hypothetical protein
MNVQQANAGALATTAASELKSQTIEAVLTRRWARMFVPSLSDLFFLAAMAWLFMGQYGWSGLLADGDVGWHIRTGEYILDHHAVPRQDLYSFSKPGAPWYAWEWLSDTAFAVLFRAGGLKGIVLFAGVAISLFATTLMRRMIRRNVNMFIAVVISLLGVGSASMHFLARPHIFTLLLISVSMWLLERDRDVPAKQSWLPGNLWWLVPLSLLWTNLHGGFLVLTAILGVATVGAGIEALLTAGTLRGKNWMPAVRYATLTVSCAVVSLVNPYGWGLHQHVVEYLRSDWIRNVIQEFQSPSFRNEGMLQFEALLFIGLIAAGSLFRRRHIIEGLWILLFAYLALSSVRHVPVFIAVTIPLIAREVNDWWKAWTASASRNSLAGILNSMAADSASGFRRTSLLPVLAIGALALINGPIQWPKDFPEELFPIDMIRAHESEILHSRILTTDQWADYLIFLHPDQKVFVDGRSDFYGPEIGNQYIKLFNGAWDWRQVLEEYRFTLALVPVDQPVAQLLKQQPGWHVIADDGKRILVAHSEALVPRLRTSGQ